uniref:M949_RS01915 family surface polysaccharide biosynthesis protein n=1 Tax=Flavobacterium sp. TaxID=239 RepID=UPI00404972F8
MKIICIFFFFLAFGCGYAQNVSTAQPVNEEVWKKVVTEEIKQEMGIKYPVFKVFQFQDTKGVALIVLTESNDTVNAKAEPINTTVAAFLLRESDGNFKKEWESKYSIANNLQNESSIWYWSKYFECIDVDNDGEFELFLVYGTAGINGLDDGRVFIELFHKGKSSTIAHQNAINDSFRITTISPSFYTLPKEVKNKGIQKMQLMVTAKQAIFPTNWEENMAKNQVEINEQ